MTAARAMALFLVLATLAMPCPAHASDERVPATAEVLAEAAAAYDRGVDLLRRDPAAARRAFEAAADGYALLARSGVDDGRLWYNLGNARLQSGEIGLAIHAYLEAERLRPADPRIAANLAHARSLRKDQIATAAESAALDLAATPRRWLAPRTRLVAFVACWVALWSLLSIRIARPALAPLPVVLGVALAGAALLVTLALDVRLERRPDAGVLVAESVVVRKGNGEGFEPAIEQRLSAGVEFRVRERRGDWLRIALPDGKEGWIQASQAALVGDASAA